MSKTTGSYSYGEFASNEAELARLEGQATVAWELERGMLEQAGLKPGMQVLDLACGPGFITNRIAELVQPEGAVTGIDLNEQLLAVAQSRQGDAATSPVRFLKGDVYDLDLPAESFDFVYARFLLQHLESPVRALEQAGKVLRPGGAVCVCDSDDGLLGLYPEPPGFRAFVERVAEHQRRIGGDREVGRKLGYYVKAAGFEGVCVRVAVVTSEQLGMRTFLDITTGFKRELAPPEQREAVAATLADIYRHGQQPGAFGVAGVYCVTGRKPA